MALFPNPQSPWSTPQAETSVASVDTGLRQYMLGVYNYMTSALLLTAIVAWFAAHSPAVMNAMYTMQGDHIVGMNGLGWLVTFAPLVFVLVFSFKLRTMSFSAAQGVFWAYSAIMGLSLTPILYAYTGASVTRAFLTTAILFGSMSLYGYSTKRDLTGMGSFLIMGLWGVIIASLVNMFLHSAGMDFMLSILCVIIFTGLTAYDTQNLKTIYYQVAGADRETMGKAALMGALRLYLDFINLFLTMLRLFGDRR